MARGNRIGAAPTIIELRRRLNYGDIGKEDVDRWRRLSPVMRSFKEDFRTRNGKSSLDLTDQTDPDGGLKEMVDTFLDKKGNGARFWPSRITSRNFNKLQYSFPAHTRKIKETMKELFLRRNKNDVRNSRAKRATETDLTTQSSPEICVKDGAVNMGDNAATNSTNLLPNAPEAPMFPDFESRLEPQPELLGEETIVYSNVEYALKRARPVDLHEESSRLDGIDDVDCGSRSHKRPRINGRLDYNGRVYRSRNQDPETTHGSDRHMSLRSHTRTQPAPAGVIDDSHSPSEPSEIVDFTDLMDSSEDDALNSPMRYKNAENTLANPFSRPPQPVTRRIDDTVRKWSTTPISGSLVPLSNITPQIETTYRFVSSREPDYDVRYLGFLPNFHQTSLRELKKELSIEDVETVVIRLHGSKLKFCCTISGDNDRLFQLSKREMNGMIANHSKGAYGSQILEMVVEIEALRDQ